MTTRTATTGDTADVLGDLLTHLDRALRWWPCDGGFSRSHAWALGEGIDTGLLGAVLTSRGSACDCEVLLAARRRTDGVACGPAE